MTNEVRAAAERLEHWLWEAGHLFDEDVVDALKVLLAEHPADDDVRLKAAEERMKKV